ncbi:23S rRNA (adenine(2030)-N(6))-methyltransferase RlmJ [Halomonas sp. GXIMD04776]|uniref:23S rRNA (adenine(2030)-N(6))-methyltransferase RlmJ n=1 Tax=Halomonas sp. GXIMD04776 TaxID=3415605 RepID=UPI003CC0877D
MLAYQHAYHAGNFADVHKHLILFAAQRNLLRKETAVTYVDTHAGRGNYPLADAETQKLKEYEKGVLPLWRTRAALTNSDGSEKGLIHEWLGELAKAQGVNRGQLTHYPGSPWWLAQALRQQDRLHLFELHPGEQQHLEAQPLPSNAQRYRADGLLGLRGMLPVATPRLCVLIDPSYERKQEYNEVAETLAFVARKVRHAVVLVWYPLLPAGRHQSLLDDVKQAGLRKLWCSELRHHAPGQEHGMYGSGLLLFNPPWGLDRKIENAMQRVVTCLGGEACHRGYWWVGE